MASVSKKTGTETSKRSAIAYAMQTHKTGDYLGDLVAWVFASNDGFSHDRRIVARIFERWGFPDIVSRENDIASALIVAPRRGVKKGRNIIVKTMDRPNRDTPAALAVYYKNTIEGEIGDDFVAGARVRVVNDLAVALPMEGKTDFDEDCMRVAKNIAAKANEVAKNITNKELSVALCAAGSQSMWTTFRKKQGGVWFVYERFTKRFRSLLDDLEQLGGFYPTIQPLYVDDEGRSMKNVESASKGVLETELGKLRDDFKKALDEGMRDSSLKRRLRDCDELLGRADLYGSLLADKAAHIRKQTDKLKAQFEKMLNGTDDVFDDLLAKVDVSEYSEQINDLASGDEVFAGF